MNSAEELRESYRFSDDLRDVDRETVWSFLSGSAYWGRWRRRADVETQIDSAWRVVSAIHSQTDGMVGFARAVSDGVAVAYLADVFVLPDHRGRGIGRHLVGNMIDAGPGAEFRWLLHTQDAHALYAGHGFSAPDRTLMERNGRKQT